MYTKQCKGNGQGYCSGCLAKGKQPVNWCSMMNTLYYAGGEKIGTYCSECLDTIIKSVPFKIEVNQDENDH